MLCGHSVLPFAECDFQLSLVVKDLGPVVQFGAVLSRTASLLSSSTVGNTRISLAARRSADVLELELSYFLPLCHHAPRPKWTCDYTRPSPQWTQAANDLTRNLVRCVCMCVCKARLMSCCCGNFANTRL